MKICAVIFDIYKTLLEVGPPPVEGESRWLFLWQKLGKPMPLLSLAEFNAKSRQFIARTNGQAAARGIAFPEVYWPHIATTVLPDLHALSARALDDFLYQHAKLERTVRLAPGAAGVLKELVRQALPLGLCSNCQPYTLREMSDALATARLSMRLFEPQLCFFSFVAGFSKPNPKAFQRLEQSLAEMGIPIPETLMVGDRLDNDILPAQARGWQSWHMARHAVAGTGGAWQQLEQVLLQQRTLLAPSGHIWEPGAAFPGGNVASNERL